MKYVALLRGINVGGNNIIKMSALKAAFEKSGYTQVRTYINSGNVIFTSEEKNSKKITDALEAMLTKTFSYNARVMIRSHQELKDVQTHFPKEWKNQTDLRCYVGFLADALSPEESAKEIKIKEGIDFLETGPGVLYMTTLMSLRTKSSFNKLVGTNIYKEMTIRNYTTVNKLLKLMET